MLYKGYIKTKGKKAIEAFKDRTKYRTYDEVKNLEGFGGVLADDTILIDIDDAEQSEILMNIVEEYQLDCRVYCTSRGRHFLFKNHSITRNRTHVPLAVGLTADIKLGTRSSYEVIKIDGEERFIEWDIEEGGTYQEVPKWLSPVRTAVDFLDMDAGDGRNQALFNYILTLTSNDFSVDDTRECIRILNRFVLKEPLSDDELEVILRDEAFQKPVFFCDKTFLFDRFATWLKNNENVVSISNQLHIYQDGIYQVGYKAIETAMINQIPNLKKTQRREVLEYMELIADEKAQADARYIAFRNGVLDIVTGQMQPFSPDLVITNQIPWDYNPEAYSELADDTLNKLACGDQPIRALLEECIGYCFYRRNELGKAFILTGDKSNGTVEEIKMFIDEDAASVKKHFARIGERYFDGDHDIKNYRMFYFNSDGQLVEDTSRANVRIPHPFFKELTEQGTQYTLSGSDGFVFSDVPELQSELDARFNNNDDFIDELSETLTDCQTKGFAYMYAMKDSTDKLKFTCADSIGVVEVEARFAEDGKDHVIYWYVDRVDKEGHRIKKIMDWDDEQVVYYVQTDEGEIQLDDKAKVNPRPHILYQVDGDDNTYIDSLGFLPFFRLDNNKKQISNLKAVKDLIDDYDLMASSLSNNLIDFDHPLYAVKGFEGDNLDELQQNLKTKKIVGVGSDGGIEVHTVDVPYEARKVKLELDEKNIYRFGMGLNLSGLKDTSATTNIAIKAAYSLLDLRCKHLERNIKRFLRKIVAVCIDEINQQNGTDYQITDVYFEFTHEVMSNEQENEQNELTEAQKQQVQINTLLSLAQIFGDDLTIQYICDVLDIDYEDVKDKLPDNEADKVQQVQDDLDSIIPDDEGGGIGEQSTEGSAASTA